MGRPSLASGASHWYHNKSAQPRRATPCSTSPTLVRKTPARGFANVLPIWRSGPVSQSWLRKPDSRTEAKRHTPLAHRTRSACIVSSRASCRASRPMPPPGYSAVWPSKLLTCRGKARNPSWASNGTGGCSVPSVQPIPRWPPGMQFVRVAAQNPGDRGNSCLVPIRTRNSIRGAICDRQIERGDLSHNAAPARSHRSSNYSIREGRKPTPDGYRGQSMLETACR